MEAVQFATVRLPDDGIEDCRADLIVAFPSTSPPVALPELLGASVDGACVATSEDEGLDVPFKGDGGTKDFTATGDGEGDDDVVVSEFD